ncbi:MAG TPA: hypothetical protein VN943_05800 [Candidatus Acidoferrum sp.]|nr:hypothetical protein [Candidatus Acidoferrum sp.]
MAAPARTMSGSRFLRPKLSRFFNQVAQAYQRISSFVKGAPAPPPPMLDNFSSKFFTKPPPPREPVATPRPTGQSRFLPPKTLSRFFNQAAQPRPRTSRFSEGKAALQPPMPDIFSSMFYTKPKKPRPHNRPNWPPPKKPRGPGL